jgi:flagellar biosynthesis protein FlhF
MPASELASMQRELGSMRRLLEDQLSGLFWNELKRSQPRRVAVLKALSNLGLDADLARAIADEFPQDLPAERARLLPQALLARRIPVGKPDPILEGGVVALVGSTGAGKTTTIAKLAARFAQHNRPRDIALVTLDHYRIGAQEQIHSYGRLLGVPVHALQPDQDLGRLLEQLSDRRLVLIDTAGMSQRDRSLPQQLERLAVVGAKLRTHVVLAANAANPDEVVRRFAALKPAGAILTKIDEASCIGAALSAVVRHALPLSYVAHGQRVPEDLHLAHADRLVLCATQLARAVPKALDDESLAQRFATPLAKASAIHA